MSQNSAANPLAAAPELQKAKGHGRRLMEEPSGWLDVATTYVADRCSPILVKETRQALKSRQFQWTFLMLLLAVVIWSFLGISFALRVGAEENGATMLAGYLVILGFPLAVVIPMAAFRSLAREYEDETIQLVSITSMSARRIVIGKLGSAAMQIALYMAAVTPCIVFSYVLRGLSFSMIWVGVAIAGTGSLMLTCLALAMAGACRNAFLRVAANLFLLLALLGAFGLWIGIVMETSMFARQEDGFLIVSNFIAVMFLTVAFLLVESTASLISFAAENRSSRVRIALLVLAAVFVSGVLGTILETSGSVTPIEPCLVMTSCFCSFYFTIVGCMTASERSGLSNRVRRELPTSMLGRFVRGIFMPGPGRGFLFATTAILTVNAFVLALDLSKIGDVLPYVEAGSMGFGRGRWQEIYVVNAVFGCGYVAFIYLVMLLLERPSGAVKTLVGLMLGVITFVLISILTMTAHEFLNSYQSSNEISPAYYLNWPVMLVNSVDNNGPSHHFYGFLILVGFPASLLVVFAYFVSLRELAVSAASVPKRVLEDDKPKAKSRPSADTFEEVFQQRQLDKANAGTPTDDEAVSD